jgi:hypothetical protein
VDVFTSNAPFFVGTDRQYQSLVLSDIDYSWIRSPNYDDRTGALRTHDIVRLATLRKLSLDLHLMHHASLTGLRAAAAHANRRPTDPIAGAHGVCVGIQQAVVSTGTPAAVVVTSGGLANDYVAAYWLDFCGQTDHWRAAGVGEEVGLGAGLPVAKLWEQLPAPHEIDVPGSRDEEEDGDNNDGQDGGGGRLYESRCTLQRVLGLGPAERNALPPQPACLEDVVSALASSAVSAPILPAVLLPFHDDLSIDEASYRAHLRDVGAVKGVTLRAGWASTCLLRLLLRVNDAVARGRAHRGVRRARPPSPRG